MTQRFERINVYDVDDILAEDRMKRSVENLVVLFNEFGRRLKKIGLEGTICIGKSEKNFQIYEKLKQALSTHGYAFKVVQDDAEMHIHYRKRGEDL